MHSDKDVPHLQSSETTSSSHLAAVAVRKRDAQAAQLDSAVGTGSPSTKRPRGGRQAPLQRNSGSAEMEVSDEEFSDEVSCCQI